MAQAVEYRSALRRDTPMATAAAAAKSAIDIQIKARAPDPSAFSED